MSKREIKALRGPTPRHKEGDEVVYIDNDSAPRLIFSGEDILCEDLPVGTRVIYAKPPIEGLNNPGAAIRYAINHPLDADPLYAQLAPGMRVTIALDDISLPLPPMRTPDIRQTILEILLEQLDANGVDDVHLIVANCLHRFMTKDEMKRMVGKKIFDAFYPDRFYNHDAEDPDNIVHLGTTSHGEPVNINRRCVESDLVIYVNVMLVPMDGGHKSVTVGLCDYASVRVHHEPDTLLGCDSMMDPSRSMLHTRINRQGAIVDQHMKVFHIETALNNRMFANATAFLGKNEDEFSEFDRMKYEGMRFALSKLPTPAKRKIFSAIPAEYELIACHAGKTEPVHERILAKLYDQYMVSIKGQSDIVIFPIPFVSPYSINSIMNPILVQVMGLGYFHQFYRGKPVLKKGGALILCHPCHDEFDHKFHPSYIEFFNRLLPETRDSHKLMHKYEEEFARNPSYIEMYRRGNAYHGTHPFNMWYWGEPGRRHAGKIIAAGAKNAHVPARLGWDRADSLTEAISQARSFVGPSPSITLMKWPPIVMADVE
jgi:lactate racemase